MNDLSDLEAELKKLQPRAVSPELSARVETAFAQPLGETRTAGMLPRPRKLSRNWLAIGLGLGAAAAFVGLALVGMDRATHTQRSHAASGTSRPPLAAEQTSRGFVPEGLTRVVYNTRDEGLVYPTSSSQPVRRVRSRAHETLQWTEPGTGASLRVSYPTDEVELIPVTGQ